MSDVSAVKALVFDVFGTVVDWRSSLIADFNKWGATRGINADWTALVEWIGFPPPAALRASTSPASGRGEASRNNDLQSIFLYWMKPRFSAT